MDYIGLAFSFLHFYRRIIIGFFLIVALVYFLKFGLNRNPEIHGDQNVRVKEPAPEIDSTNANPIQDDKIPGQIDLESIEETGLSSNPSISTHDDKPAGVLRTKLDRQDEPTAPSPKTGSADRSVSRLIANGNKDELIRESVRLKSASEGVSPAESFVLMNDRKKIAKRLLEMDLSSEQQQFVKCSYVEALSVMDSINTQANLRVDAIRTELKAEIPRFFEDKDSRVSGLAHLAIVFSSGADYLQDGSLEGLAEFDQLLDTHFDPILLDRRTANKLAELILAVKRSPVFNEQTNSLADKYLARFDAFESEKYKELTAVLRQALFFSHFDLKTLVDRLARNSSVANDEVNEFFAALQEFPECAVSIHQVALDVIREMIRKSDIRRARDLIQIYEQKIIMKIVDEELRTKITIALDELKSFIK